MAPLFTHMAALCIDHRSFLGLTAWYHYLQCQNLPTGGQVPDVSNIYSLVLIAAALIEDLIRIAALVAVGRIVWGGILYMTSSGDPAKAGQARNTIINALIGLTIAVVAVASLQFIAGKFN